VTRETAEQAIIMASSTDDVKTIDPIGLTGYIHQQKLEKFLKDLFKKDIQVIVRTRAVSS
jgi:hypothetical protein